MGSPNLSGFPLEIWNSHYVTGVAAASALYPGDGHAGWADVGGKPVAILQFTDKAQVAGQQVDANAVRGAGKLAELFGGEVKELDAQQSEMFAQMHRELTQKLPSRSKYRANDDLVDSLAGFVLNTDGRIHEGFVENEAAKGVQWALDLVKREADKGDQGARAALDRAKDPS